MKKEGVIFIAKTHKPPGLLFVMIATIFSLLFFIFNRSTAPTPNQAIAAATQNAVSIQNMQFTPAQITIPAGTTVTWTNQETNIPHTVTSDQGLWDSGVLQPRQSFSHMFSTPGTYSYHCSIHPFMHGTIVVTGTMTTSPSPQMTTYPSPTSMQQPMRRTYVMPVTYSYPSPTTYPSMQTYTIPMTVTYSYPPPTPTMTPAIPPSPRSVSVMQTQSQSQNINITANQSTHVSANQSQTQSQSVSISSP